MRRKFGWRYRCSSRITLVRTFLPLGRLPTPNGLETTSSHIHLMTGPERAVVHPISLDLPTTTTGQLLEAVPVGE